MKNPRPKTIFCDIDGTLVEHAPPIISSTPDHSMLLLEGTLGKLTEWDMKGYNIILTTGRKESMRTQTERQLREVGIFYDQLVMGIGGGERVVINDKKPNSTKNTAHAISITRNKGIKDVKI